MSVCHSGSSGTPDWLWESGKAFAFVFWELIWNAHCDGDLQVDCLQRHESHSHATLRGEAGGAQGTETSPEPVVTGQHSWAPHRGTDIKLCVIYNARLVPSCFGKKKINEAFKALSIWPWWLKFFWSFHSTGLTWFKQFRKSEPIPFDGETIKIHLKFYLVQLGHNCVE